MNIHEYQAKQILKKYGVNVPQGQLVEPREGDLSKLVFDCMAELDAYRPSAWVVKAQIHAGGRGQAGGVKVCRTREAVLPAVRDILGKTLVTPQTGPQGKKVHKVWIETACAIDKEFYFSILIDRKLSSVVVLASTEGGMEIEEVASHSPEKITQVAVDSAIGFQPFHARKIASALGIPFKSAVPFFTGLYQAFMQEDCSLLEVNPLVLTQEGHLIALDAKVNFDDNALYRHPETLAMKDPLEENALDLEAAKYDLNYIALDGTIGCMVNGAGLAMATLDIIQYFGGSAANFLDVGGGATKEKVTAAFKLILSDERVNTLLVNIFGGIMKCDVIAEGIVAAARELSIEVPLVVRLQGTRVSEGRKILQDSGLRVLSAETLSEAAKMAVIESKKFSTKKAGV